MKNRWLLLIISWQIIGIGYALAFSYPIHNFHGFIYRLMLTLSIVNSVALTGSVVFLIIDAKLNRDSKHNWIYFGISIIVIVGSYFLSKTFVTPFVNSVCDANVKHDVDKNHIYVITANFVMSVAIVASYLILYFYFKLKNDWERKVYEIESLKRLQLETKFTLLQSKVNPHFLFNTLNTVLNLIYKVPDKVETIILNLSEIYRNLLNLPESQPITIEEELRLVNRYLEIEKIRLNERLEYSISANEETLTFLIPPLILQTLVENAVIHGIAPKKNGGKIMVEITNIPKGVLIVITDTGVGYQSSEVHNGFGIYSVKERLKLRYKGNAGFEITGSQGSGTIIKISLPNE